jgi:hypothetical protein
MKGINVEVWYNLHGVDVKSNVNLYFSGFFNVKGTLKVIRDCYKSHSSNFRNFVVSVNHIDKKFNDIGYSRIKIEGDGQGNFVIDYDVLGSKSSFDFKTVFVSTSKIKSVNALIDKVYADIIKLSAETVEVG